MLENNIIVYKFVQDLHFFVTGGDDENELILATVLQGFFDAITLLLRFYYSMSWNCLVCVSWQCTDWFFVLIDYLCFRNNVDQREALENLDLILLCLDEIVDGGYVMNSCHLIKIPLARFLVKTIQFLFLSHCSLVKAASVGNLVCCHISIMLRLFYDNHASSFAVV